MLVVHHLESLSCRFLEALGVGLSYDGLFFGISINSCDIIPDEMGLFTLLIVDAGLAPALVRVHGTHIKPTQVAFGKYRAGSQWRRNFHPWS